MKRVTRDQLCQSFSADNPPVLHVQPGEIFVMETNDRFATYQGPGSPPEIMGILKDMAGPVYIDGAQPGDTLKIEVLDVNLPHDYGWIGATPGRGALGDRIPQFRKTKVSITKAGVVFNDKVTLPLRLMTGRIGVAPQDGPRDSIEKGAWGGAMGNTQITAGTAVYLPVFHPGGLLTIGDCHAAMGDGEVAASVVECAFDATLRVSIPTDFKATLPVIASQHEAMTTAEGPTMEEATRSAVGDLADIMVERLGMDYTDAAMIIAGAADVRISLASTPPTPSEWLFQRPYCRCRR
jgi:amidase